MRYVILIIDVRAVAGEAGEVQAALGRAETPNLDRLGESGRVGAVALDPTGRGSLGVGLLTLLGYDESAFAGLSPAVLEAVAMDASIGPGDWAMRLDLVGVSADDDDGLMHGDAGASREETNAVLGDLIAHWREACPEHMERVVILGHGVSRLLVDRDGPDYSYVETVRPGAIAGKPWVEHLPDGGEPLASERLCTLISESRHFLADHPVNRARAEQGLTPANLVWLWGAGTALGLSPLREHVPHRVAMLADAVEAVGVGRLIGIESETPGGVGSLADRISASGAEVVCAVVGDDIERVDAEVIGPLVRGLGDPQENPWRLLVAVSHGPGHRGDGGMSPFVLAGSWVRSVVPRRLCDGLTSDLRVDPGSELLEYVLRAGLRGRV